MGYEFDILYTRNNNVMCDKDHPRVYYTLQDGEAICGYCNTKYIHINRIKSEVIRNTVLLNLNDEGFADRIVNE